MENVWSMHESSSQNRPNQTQSTHSKATQLTLLCALGVCARARTSERSLTHNFNIEWYSVYSVYIYYIMLFYTCHLRQKYVYNTYTTDTHIFYSFGCYIFCCCFVFGAWAIAPAPPFLSLSLSFVHNSITFECGVRIYICTLLLLLHFNSNGVCLYV